MEAVLKKILTNLDDLIENTSAIKEAMATKDDVDRIEKKLDAFENKMTMELRAINDELEDIKNRLTSLEKKTQEDDDATIKDVLDLRKRVVFLEKQVKLLQGAH